MEKIDANGDDRHPNYEVLIDVTDAEGHRGDVRWNFGEPLINADGTITHFGPMIAPDGPALVADIEAGLSSSRAPEQQVGRERGCPSALLTTPDTRAR